MVVLLLVVFLGICSAEVLDLCRREQLQELHSASKTTSSKQSQQCLLQVKSANERRRYLTPGERIRAYLHSWSPHGDQIYVDLLLDQRSTPHLSIPQIYEGIKPGYLRPRSIGKPSLCGLMLKGSLVDEARAFLEHFAGRTELAHLLERMWVGTCSARVNTSDVALVNALRALVQQYTEMTTTRQPTSTFGHPTTTNDYSSGKDSDTSNIEVRPDECVYEDRLLWLLGLNSSDARVMDYGSGSGSRLVTFNKCEIGQQNVGVDVQDVRTAEAKESFDFVQLEDPYVESFANTITERHFEGAFDLVLSDVTYHHIGSEDMIRATTAQLGRVLRPCGAFVLSEWDNAVDMASGRPDLTPLWDLVHTYSQTLCLPWAPPRKECAGNLTSADLHKMWEGSATAYLSRVKYQEIMLQEAGLTLARTYRNTRNSTIAESNWTELLHPFTQVFLKGSDCMLMNLTA